jgi:hypothetical protein
MGSVSVKWVVSLWIFQLFFPLFDFFFLLGYISPVLLAGFFLVVESYPVFCGVGICFMAIRVIA